MSWNTLPRVRRWSVIVTGIKHRKSGSRVCFYSLSLFPSSLSSLLAISSIMLAYTNIISSDLNTINSSFFGFCTPPQPSTLQPPTATAAFLPISSSLDHCEPFSVRQIYFFLTATESNLVIQFL